VRRYLTGSGFLIVADAATVAGGWVLKLSPGRGPAKSGRNWTGEQVGLGLSGQLIWHTIGTLAASKHHLVARCYSAKCLSEQGMSRVE